MPSNAPFPLSPWTRGTALFLGAFTLVSVVRDLLDAGTGANHWWIDLRALPSPLALGVYTTMSALLLAAAARPRPGSAQRRVTRTAVLGCAAVALLDVIRVAVLAVTGRVDVFPAPVSALVLAGLLALAHGLRDTSPRQASPSDAAPTARPRWAILNTLLVCGACATGFALAQMVAFGRTDYRRPADAIVVLGARAYADGTPSQALADRVATACTLWRDGLAPRLILSGGRGENGVHECDVMRRVALAEGVPDTALVLDRDGTTSRATVANTAALAPRLGLRRVLVVSHAYHLPRLKMTFERTALDAFTVPAAESRTLLAMPWFMAREVAALWVDLIRA